MIDCACKASTALNAMFADFQPDRLRQEADAIHEIEHAADLKKHDMMSRLLREFLPPIDREDIVNISHVLDEIVDLIEEVVLSLYMNDIHKCRPDVMPMVDLIVKQCQELQKLMAEFENYKKSDKLMDSIIAINTMEEEGDKLHREAMRNLKLTCSDPLRADRLARHLRLPRKLLRRLRKGRGRRRGSRDEEYLMERWRSVF